MARPGNAAASRATRPAAADTLVPGAGAPLFPCFTRVFLPGRTSRASTGRHTGRVQNDRCTTIPQVTKQVLKDSLSRVGAEPSYCQPAP